MSVTDTFGKLKAQVEEADRTVRTAAEQNQAEIEQKVNDARRETDERGAGLRSKGQEPATEGKTHWQEIQADLDRHIQDVRQRLDATKATVDAKVAKSDADFAEANATDAIAFALSAIVEAEYATLDAV